MAKNSNQEKPQKPQPDRGEKITINESIIGSGDAGGSNRERKGMGGVGTRRKGRGKKD